MNLKKKLEEIKNGLIPRLNDTSYVNSIDINQKELYKEFMLGDTVEELSKRYKVPEFFIEDLIKRLNK